MAETPGGDDVQALLDRLRIRELQAAYGDIVTRQAWPELVPLFHPTASITLDLRGAEPVRLVGPVELGHFIRDAVARFEFFEFALLNTVIDQLDGDAARGRLYMWELRHLAATGEWSNAFGLYQDEYSRLDGRWVFTARRYSSLARVGDTATVFPLPPM